MTDARNSDASYGSTSPYVGSPNLARTSVHGMSLAFPAVATSNYAAPSSTIAAATIQTTDNYVVEAMAKALVDYVA